ncbi:Myosin heavy chain, muscle, partial [Orchesella cincta]
MSYYCPNAVENAPNRQIVCDILQELQCVIDKSLGHSENLQVGYQDLGSELHRLKEEIVCYVQTINELEIKLKHLECDNQRLIRCFEEESTARANLEMIVCELRAQIERQNEVLNIECTEKTAIAGELKHLEMTIQNYRNQVCDLEAETEQLHTNCKGYEGKLCRTTELQTALTQCCKFKMTV